MKTTLSMRGAVTLRLFDKNGNLKDSRENCNLITELMDAHVADALSDVAEAPIGFIAIGTGSGQIASDVGLDVSASRKALVSVAAGVAGDDNDVIYTTVFNPTEATGIITEAGLMRDDNNTSMMAYTDTFDPITKALTDTLTVTWTITFGAS